MVHQDDKSCSVWWKFFVHVLLYSLLCFSKRAGAPDDVATSSHMNEAEFDAAADEMDEEDLEGMGADSDDDDGDDEEAGGEDEA